MSRNRSGRAARRPRLLLALVVVLALTACGGGGAVSTQPAAAGPDGDWVLTSGTAPAGALVLVDGSPVTLTVTGRTVSGRAACNSYSGDVAASGGGFRPGSIAMTEMACTDPAVSALERGYLDAFAAVTTATAATDRLVLTGEGVELTFRREAPVVDRPLEGTRWVLDTAFAGETASSVVGGSFLRLDAGDLTGNAGCLDLTGAYRVDGATVTVTDLRLPEGVTADCDQDASVQDSLVRGFLTGPAITATVDGDRLTLMRGDTGYGFTAAP